MNILKRIVLTWAIVMVTTIITMPNAYAQDQAAVVIVAAGEVYAVDKQQNKRSLQRRSKVFVGDTLITGKQGRTQIRFIDGAVVSLRPESELNIQKYAYGKTKADEGSLMTLIKGGFRTITGAIGKEKYKLITSMATIGIRGTHYEVVIDNGQMFVALWDGGVTLSNNAGAIDLGLGANHNFAMVQGVDVEPQGQIDPPAAIVNQSQPEFAPDLSSNNTGKDPGSPVPVLVEPNLASPESPSQTDEWSMPTTGTATYANVTSVTSTGSTGTINNFTYNATIDFAAATINGNMTFLSHSGANSWDVNFSGGPTGADSKTFSMTVDNTTSKVNGFDPVSGTVSGNFTKDAAGMDGEFHLVNDTDSTTADGTFTATQ